MTKRTKKKTRAKRTVATTAKSNNLIVAILALALNIIPGLGSLVGGKTRTGIWQLLIFAISLIVYLFFPLGMISPLIYAVGLIWGISTGIEFIKKAR